MRHSITKDSHQNRRRARTAGLALAATVALLAGCERGAPLDPDPTVDLGRTAPGTVPGAVYTMTNDAAGNAVMVFTRSSDGALTPVGPVMTGGLGSGGGLGNQGSIALSQDRRFLFVVNAGSDDVTSFAVSPKGLTQVARVPSGGARPVSLTVHDDLLYVLNADGGGSIAGFRVRGDGTLSPIAGSARPLSGAAVTAPAQIAFSRDGRVLAVSEKATSLIDIYVVGSDGTASAPHVYPSAGDTPFGLAFGLRGDLIVSEAFGGAAGTASASSYRVSSDGGLQLVTGSLGNTQTAACWAAVTKDGRFAYTSNTPANTISGYRIDADGSLSLIDADGLTAVTNPGDLPLDIDFSHDGRYLYVLNSGVGSVGAYAIRGDGSLTHLGNTDALLVAGVANGIAAW
jgi:6-phosphogluconolactonase (cycloisomerase 2 family)